MPKLRVTIIDEVRNRRLKVDLPDDAAMEKLLPALAKKLGLPATDPGGQPIAYRLTHEATERTLGGDQTLASFGVGEGDALRLATAREVKPVEMVEEEAVSIWQKVPVWAWVGIGGVVLVAVAALAFLTGRGAKLEPTPTVIAEVTTPAATEAPTLPALTPTATPAPPTSTPTSTPTPRPPTPTLTPKPTVPTTAGLTVLVSDAGSGQPVAGAQVKVSSFSLGYDQTQQTDIGGQATFAGLRPSSGIDYSIRVVAEGYRIHSGQAQVGGVGENSTTVELRPLIEETAAPIPTSSPTVVASQPSGPPQEVVITARTYAGANETWRGQNIVDVASLLNALLETEGDNRRVTVKLMQDEPGWYDYNQEFIYAARSGNAPDIISSGHEQVAAWAQAGYIIPLDDYINQHWDDTYSDVYPALWNAVTYQSVRWGVPQDTEARPMFFSKRLLQQFGWSEDDINALPGRIERGEFSLYDMLNTAKQAQDAGIVQPGYGYWHRPIQGVDFYEFYYAFGGQLQDLATGKLELVKDAMLKHLQFHADAVLNYGTTIGSMLDTSWDDWHTTVSGADRVVFWNGGTWHWAQWRDYRGGDEDYLWQNIGFSLIPAGEAGRGAVTLSHPLVYMISANAAHPDLAFRLITLATDPALNARHAVASNHLAILQSEVNDPTYAASRFLRDTAYMLGYTTFLPNHPDWDTYDQIVFDALVAVEQGQMTPETALSSIENNLRSQLGDKVIIR